jgi:L,D-transpeptidase catalytic domain
MGNGTGIGPKQHPSAPEAGPVRRLPSRAVMRSYQLLGPFALAALACALPSPARAQSIERRATGVARMSALRNRDTSFDRTPTRTWDATGYEFRSRADSMSWVRNRALADRATGFRLVVSLQDRHLWTIMGDDTLLSAPVAVAKGTTLEYAGREYRFDTPRGIRRVLKKESDPVWMPPDWLYVETAEEHGLEVRRLVAGHPIKLEDGRVLTVRDTLVGLIQDGEFAPMPTDEHIVFYNTLYIPPMGTKNRKIEGELGRYRLDLGEGYLLHGTPYQDSIGMAATHGCVRLRDEDIEWLFDHVPVGTRVYIY